VNSLARVQKGKERAMPTPRQIAEAIVAREGGFVNDPDDPGGATKHGVTIGTLRRLGRDLTGDGRVTVADIRALTPDHAVDIFLDSYFRQPGIDGLPGPLQPSVFDMQVNAGGDGGEAVAEPVAQDGA
jgi:lysozyme family protein